MPSKWETPLEEFWASTVKSLLFEKGDTYVQIRKLFLNHSFSIPGEVFNTGIAMGYPLMGYANNTAKEKQLTRNYLNTEELDSANSRFVERINSKSKRNYQSCISARMGNLKKDSRSQGFCMQTITINYVGNYKGSGPRLAIDLNYRSTELLNKFLADLKFLHEVVIPRLLDGIEIPITVVNFYFSMSYISLMYLPLLYRNESIYEILLELRRSDPQYFRLVLPATDKLMQKDTNYNYQSRLKQYNFFQKHCLSKLGKKEIAKINSHIKNEKALKNEAY